MKLIELKEAPSALLALPLMMMVVGMGVVMVAGVGDLALEGRAPVLLLPQNDGNIWEGEGMECVPCDVLFSQLKPNEWGGRDQDVEMQLRGEVCTACCYRIEIYADLCVYPGYIRGRSVVLNSDVHRLYGTVRCTYEFHIFLTFLTLSLNLFTQYRMILELPV